MYNVIPEMDTPPMDARYFGEIMNLKTRACWEITDDYLVGLTYFCFEHKIIPNNNFALTTDGLLRYRDKCVQVSVATGLINFSPDVVGIKTQVLKTKFIAPK